MGCQLMHNSYLSDRISTIKSHTNILTTLIKQPFPLQFKLDNKIIILTARGTKDSVLFSNYTSQTADWAQLNLTVYKI